MELRPATADDSRACFGVFRASLFDLLRRQGYATEPGDDAAERWPTYQGIFDHLAATHAAWWVAVSEDDAPYGYARSTLRGTTVELTEFFVHPEARVKGVGRALLERAFTVGWGEHRSIIATLDAPAVALYLRFGVRPQSTAAGFVGRPGPAEPPQGLEVEEATAEAVLALEEELLGHARPEDVAFFLASRPGIVVRRGGQAIGYAFGPDAAGDVGPIAARDPEDLPALLAFVERAAHARGQEELELELPLTATPAVTYLLQERGFRLDPFYTLLLADAPWAKFDRYLPYNPCLVL